MVNSLGLSSFSLALLSADENKYGNLVTTSPSSKREGLNNFSAVKLGNLAEQPIRCLHQHVQSVGATGGVYKGQGRNQREMMTHAY